MVYVLLARFICLLCGLIVGMHYQKKKRTFLHVWLSPRPDSWVKYWLWPCSELYIYIEETNGSEEAQNLKLWNPSPSPSHHHHCCSLTLTRFSPTVAATTPSNTTALHHRHVPTKTFRRHHSPPLLSPSTTAVVIFFKIVFACHS